MGQKIPNIREIESFLSKIDFKNSYTKAYSKINADRFCNSLRWLHPYLNHKQVLELGSRPFVFSLLAQKFYPNNRYWFTDFPKKKKRLFQFRDGSKKTVFHLETKVFDLEKTRFPFPNNSCDVVLIMETLEHLREDPMFMIKEANRVLRKGGLVFITTPNSVSWGALFRLLQMQSPLEAPTYTPGGRGNYKEYTPREVRALLESGGFKIKSLRTLNNTNVDDFLKLGCIKESAMDILKKWNKNTHLRDLYIYGLAQKIGPIKNRYPKGIYTTLAN